tara:strand:- start:880 stop:1176 length:297 start_codon:yes stop_codon:yes gene_type:complete
MKLIPGFSVLEKNLNKSTIIFSLVVMFVGLFGGSFSKAQAPKNLQKLSENQYFRLATLFLIAYTATKDLETAAIATALFVIIVYAIKTPEERKKSQII